MRSVNRSGGSDAGNEDAGRWLLWVDENSALALGHLPPPAVAGRLGNIPALYTLDLLAGETVSQVSIAVVRAKFDQCSSADFPIKCVR